MKKPARGEIIEAVAKSCGIMTDAAKKLNVSRQSLWEWIKKDEILKKEVSEAKESLKDFAESKLLENIKNNDTTSIIFALKTLAKDRGYVERQEIAFDKDMQINVGYSDGDEG